MLNRCEDVIVPGINIDHEIIAMLEGGKSFIIELPFVEFEHFEKEVKTLMKYADAHGEDFIIIPRYSPTNDTIRILRVVEVCE